LFLSLKNDDVASVRKALVKGIPNIIENTKSNGTLIEIFFTELNKMAEDSSYQLRQLYANICFHAYDKVDKELYEKEFFPRVLKLSQDTVPNVRVIIYKCLQNLLTSNFGDPEMIKNIIVSLEEDVKDVVYCKNKDK